MNPFVVKPLEKLQGALSLPGDKSIAHRAIILSALSFGKTSIKNFPPNKDCLSTISVFKKLGIKISKGKIISVFGRGLKGLKKPKTPIFINQSGTTMRLLLGVLAGENFQTQIKAGPVLSKRPMLRVTAPLRMMGAEIKAEGRGTRDEGRGTMEEEFPPITIRGGNLKGITYRMPVASAQVKGAILLGGLFAKGETKIIEPVKTRDHTERMLKVFKVGIKVKGNIISIKGARELVTPGSIYLPADISSAAFFLVLASLLPNSEIIIKKVSLNPSRSGIIKVLKRMGADLRVTRSVRSAAEPPRRGPGQCEAQRSLPEGDQVTRGEPMGDILVKFSPLRGTVVKKREIPSLIDELPILMVAASLARGRSVFEGAEELRVKETDRINAMSENLKKMGAKIEIIKKGKRENIIIQGGTCLRGARLRSFGDHRTVMSMIVAGSIAAGNSVIDDVSCISKSFPDFIKRLNALKK